MDLVLTIVFMLGAVLAALGAAAAALAPTMAIRLPGLLAATVGTAAMLLGLSATLAGIVAVLCLPTAALLAARAEAPVAQPVRWARPDRLTLAGIVAAVLLLAILVLIAVRGVFSGGATATFDPEVVGRALFSRDAVAADAVAAALLVGLACGATLTVRRRS